MLLSQDTGAPSAMRMDTSEFQVFFTYKERVGEGYPLIAAMIGNFLRQVKENPSFSRWNLAPVQT